MKFFKENLKGFVISFVLICSVFLGFFLIFEYPITIWMLKSDQVQMTRTHIPSSEQIKKNNQKKASYDFSTASTVNLGALVETQTQPFSYPIIGEISYPTLGIHLPILKGVGSRTMLYGAGTMKSDEVMGQGNYALASHHVSNVIGSSADGLLFSPLVHAQSGQNVYLTDKQKVYDYQVTKVFEITPSQGTVILDRQNQKQLTLVTCATDDHYRLVVQGKLSSVIDYNQKTKNLFNSNYTQYWKG